MLTYRPQATIRFQVYMQSAQSEPNSTLCQWCRDGVETQTSATLQDSPEPTVHNGTITAEAEEYDLFEGENTLRAVVKSIMQACNVPFSPLEQ